MDMLRISKKYYSHCLKQCRLSKQSKSLYSTTSSPANQILSAKVDVLKTKVYDVMKWYEQLTGIDEIRSAQNKVIEAQDRFAAAQEKRREVTLELNDLGSKIKDIQEELSGTSRGEEKYLTLITKEHKLLKEEIRLTDKLNLYEREERELFATLSSSVKDSHEKERIQANKTKYLSIIGSVMGALIGITGSTLSNRSKLSEIKKMVTLSTEENKRELLNALQQLELPGNPAANSDEIKKQLKNISDTLLKMEPESLKIESVEQTLTRLEKNVDLLMKGAPALPHAPSTTLVEESESQDEQSILSNFADAKEDITYALMSCVSMYVLYRMFFS